MPFFILDTDKTCELPACLILKLSRGWYTTVLNRLALSNRPGQSRFVREFQSAPHRHAVRDARELDLSAGGGSAFGG